MGALQYVDVPGYRALLLRRTFTQLAKGDTLIPRAHEWLAKTDAVWSAQEKRWTFPSGATIEFGHVEHESTKFDYDGAAFQYVGFDELTSFSEAQYEYIAFSRMRRRTDLAAAGVPTRARATGTPGGIGHGWVKRRFVDGRKDGAVFIPAKVYDNPGLDVPDYVEGLSHLPEGLRKQLLDGDWGAFEGMAFSKFGSHNLIDSFPLGDAHSRIEAMDYGLNGVAWALVPTDYDGNLIFYDTIGGKDLLPDEVAEMVIARRKGGWGFGNTVWADPSIFHRTGGRSRFGQPQMLDQEFFDSGVPIARANNDPRAGLVRLRTLIEPDPERRFPAWHPLAGEYGSPRLFVVAGRCLELVDQLQMAPLQPIDKADAGEKIDADWEGPHGHFCAMARYAVMSRPGASPLPSEQEPDDQRAALLWRVRREADRSVQATFDRNRYLI